MYVDNHGGYLSVHSSCINYPQRETRCMGQRQRTKGREIRKIIHIAKGILKFHQEQSHRLASVVLYIYARLQATTSELHANSHWSGLIGQTRRGVLQIMRLSPNITLHDAQTCMRLLDDLLRI
jgi:hypothetical protein